MKGYEKPVILENIELFEAVYAESGYQEPPSGQVSASWSNHNSGSHSCISINASVGNVPGNYIKEFHHQMKENFPTTSGIVIIWPLLWLATLINFIKNNKRVRSTGLLNILREADRRGKIIRRMKLWKQ